MQVFKVCFLITKRRAASLALYFFIFAVIAVITTASSHNTAGADFTASRPRITVQNFGPETPLTEGFLTFLSGKARLVPLEENGREALQDALFFHETDYIVQIPEGFSGAPSPGGLTVIQAPGSFSSYYAKILVNRYWNTVAGLLSQSPSASPETIASQALLALSASVSVATENFDAPAPLPSIYLSYGYIMAYILMALLLHCVSNVQLSFGNPAIRKRNLAAPQRPFSRTAPLFLYSLCLALISWAFFNLLGLAIYRPLQEGGSLSLVLLGSLNTFVYSLVSAGLALLVSAFLKNRTVQSVACNLISLGFCFLGGVFVPQSALSESFLGISRFLPTYWYVRAWDGIFSASDLSFGTLNPIFSHILLELLFAGTLFLSALAAEKAQSGRKEEYGEKLTDYRN